MIQIAPGVRPKTCFFICSVAVSRFFACWQTVREEGKGLPWLIAKDLIEIDRTEGLLIKQNSYIFVIHIMTYVAWQIMTYNDISLHFVIKIKNITFVAKTCNYGIFVPKIYDYTLISSFWGSTGFLDSPTRVMPHWNFVCVKKKNNKVRRQHNNFYGHDNDNDCECWVYEAVSDQGPVWVQRDAIFQGS